MSEEINTSINPRDLPGGMTRDCLDPWTYVEIRANGDVRPCCARSSAGNLGTSTLVQILEGPLMQALRASLLTATPDAQCKHCRLRAITTPEMLAQKVTAMLAGVRLPTNFDPDAYLDANPDVRQAHVDAAEHYLKWGRFEGRRLFPALGK